MRTASYVWSSPSGQLSIHLALELVDRLGLEALEALKSVPRRGLEIGGLLIGRAVVADGRTSIYVDNFEAVDSEHRTGPSYLLSEADLEKLGEALKNHPDAVGLYRTNTRSAALKADAADAGWLDRFFHRPECVFLLVRPLPATAALLIPENGSLTSVHEFPFRRTELAGVEEDAPEEPVPARPLRSAAARAMEATSSSHAAVAAPQPLALNHAPDADRAALPEVHTLADSAPTDRARAAASQVVAAAAAHWAGLQKTRKRLVAAAAVLVGFVVAAAIVRTRQVTPPETPARPSASAPVSPPAAVNEADQIVLRVDRDARSFRLAWDRNAPAIRKATRGTLYITDGSHESRLELARQELDAGVLSYWPETEKVTFRLETFAGDQSISNGTVLVVVGSPRAAPAASLKPGAPPGADSKREPPKQVAAAAEATKGEGRPSPFSPPGAERSSPASVKSAVPATEPPPEIRTSLPGGALPHLGPAPLPAREPHISVVAEPVKGSRLGRVVGKIPLLRRLRRQQEEFVPPSPVREVQPVLTAKESRELNEPVPIDVKVYVGESGKVTYAELLTSGLDGRRELASAAVYAARRWDFTPARLGETRVPGEVILHFRFAPPK